MTMVSPIDGKLLTEEVIICCLLDCDKPARQQYWEMRLDHEKQANVWMFFCSELHLELHQHSHVDLGNLPSGSRGKMILPR